MSFSIKEIAKSIKTNIQTPPPLAVGGGVIKKIASRVSQAPPSPSPRGGLVQRTAKRVIATHTPASKGMSGSINETAEAARGTFSPAESTLKAKGEWSQMLSQRKKLSF